MSEEKEKTEIERLSEDGYEMEEIGFTLDENVSNISLTDSPMKPNREDKATVITDKDGHSMKSSNVMLGYNKDNVMLPSGDYISATEYVESLATYLSENGENKVIVSRSTGKKCNPGELAELLVEAAKSNGGLSVSGKSDKITNQNTATFSILGQEDKERVFMLGNEGIELPNGEYVQEAELQQALQDYVFMTKGKGVVGDDTKKDDDTKEDEKDEDTIKEETHKKDEEKEEKEVHGVKQRKGKVDLDKLKEIAKKAIGVIGVVLVINSFTPVTDIVDVQAIEQGTGYNITQVVEVDEVDTVHKTGGELTTGDVVVLDGDVQYNYDSDYAVDRNDNFGEKTEGQVEYLSVVDDENVIQGVTYESGVNVDEFVQQVSEEKDIPVSELTPMGHIELDGVDKDGNDIDGSDMGWVELDDTVKSIEGETVHTIKEVDGTTYSGFDKDLTDGIELSDGTVLDVSYEDEGKFVYDSDGNKYRVNDLEEVEVKTTTQEEEKGIDVNFGQLGLGLGLVGAAALRKKQEDEKKKDLNSMFNEESNELEKENDNINDLDSMVNDDLSKENNISNEGKSL